MPSRAIFSMARACSGMSGRDQASGAGDRSSVLVSPGTLNTVRVTFSGTAGLLTNHSPSAQDLSTACASALPCLARSATSWKASNISRVCLSCSAAALASSALSSSSTRVAML
ncbi:hypothetical protein D3C78_1192070 [compost metagenome]